MLAAQPHSFVPDPGNGRALRDAFGLFATGVTIVTTLGPEGCVAITANSFSSVSMDPPLVLWSPARASRRYPLFAGAEHYAIHVLAADQQDLAWAVAKDASALLTTDLPVNAEGVPVLPGCLARFDCRRHAIHEAGDHAIVVGEVLHATMQQGNPLAFFGGRVARIDIN
ncbi:flavin reductase family protein [Donghicola mangrovi]|uniref:Flavin reductase family protein n=1 Tax=Donghicola mangrovi TaxID=2729614 RepID=A0A850QBI0_9RHOB|nr:flavin reductase family protein [Donghicola mangrovi]NVO25712.1 flavin reductase family protein [Donghicola mangrovi]